MKQLTIPELKHLLKDQQKAVTATRARIAYLTRLEAAAKSRDKMRALALSKGIIDRKPSTKLTLEQRQQLQAKNFPPEPKTMKPYLKTE